MFHVAGCQCAACDRAERIYDQATREPLRQCRSCGMDVYQFDFIAQCAGCGGEVCPICPAPQCECRDCKRERYCRDCMMSVGGDRYFWKHVGPAIQALREDANRLYRAYHVACDEYAERERREARNANHQ